MSKPAFVTVPAIWMYDPTATVAVRNDPDIANHIEIDGTPFFLLERTLLSGVVPLETMEQALADAKKALARATSVPHSAHDH